MGPFRNSTTGTGDHLGGNPDSTKAVQSRPKSNNRPQDHLGANPDSAQAIESRANPATGHDPRGSTEVENVQVRATESAIPYLHNLGIRSQANRADGIRISRQLPCRPNPQAHLFT